MLCCTASVRRLLPSTPDQQSDSRVDDLDTWFKHEPEFANSRLISILFAAFSGLALALAGVGLYSVVSYSVAQRTSEFGIRMALGAQRADVLRIVALSASASVGLGLASGLVLSLGLGKFITRWVENGTCHPLIALGVSLLVIVVAGLACLVPALRGPGGRSHDSAAMRIRGSQWNADADLCSNQLSYSCGTWKQR